MSKNINPLQTTASELHPQYQYTISFIVNNKDEWYKIIHECKSWFATNWKGQSKVLRKFRHNTDNANLLVTFTVPDARIASWISVKHAIRVLCVVKNPNK